MPATFSIDCERLATGFEDVATTHNDAVMAIRAALYFINRFEYVTITTPLHMFSGPVDEALAVTLTWSLTP